MTEAAGRSRLVLVADDDELIRRVVRTVLEADDFEVLEATDGREAIERAATERPRVLVLDIAMPGLNGMEVCRQVDHRTTKVLMLTAHDDPDTRAAGLAAGAAAVLSKPFSSVDLLDRVAALVVEGSDA